MRSVILAGAIVVAAVLPACRGQTSREAPVFGIRNMYDQPKYEIQEEGEFFADHRTMRPLVAGVVARDQDVDPRISEGRLPDQSGYVLEVPREVTMRMGGASALLARGQARYHIYCAPCHDETGNGQGAVQKRAVKSAPAFKPPTFHQDRIRHMPDGQLFATVSNGRGNMPPYGAQVPVDDRWAIVAYVRALEVAQPNVKPEATQ